MRQRPVWFALSAAVALGATAILGATLAHASTTTAQPAAARAAAIQNSFRWSSSC
jgi:hypothetical protein